MADRKTPRHRVLAATAALSAAAVTVGCAPVLPAVETDTALPFVLTGVSDVTEIAQLTGPGAMNDTESAAVAGTDLGSMVTVGDTTHFFFGDTFGDRPADSIGGQGGIWRSNVSAYTTDDDPTDGITFDGWRPVDDMGWAEALVEGRHDANDGTGEVTKIPTHGFAVDDVLYISYMSVTRWAQPGAWDADHAALARSTDGGQTWTVVDGPRWAGDSNFIQVAPLQVSDDGRAFIYFWAIPAGRFGDVKLMRVPATVHDVESQQSYTYFAGTDDSGQPRWSAQPDHAEAVVEGTIGELSVMWSTYLERWIMTYSDGGNAYIREGLAPWGPWNDPIELVSAADYPGLYSPYVNSRYVSADGRTVYFTLSLWGPYNVFWFSAELERID